LVYLRWLFIAIAICGLFGAVFPSFKPIIKQSRYLIRRKVQDAKRSFLYQHLDQILYLNRGENNVARYLYTAAAIFVGTFALTFIIASDLPKPTSENALFRGNIQIGSNESQLLFAVISSFLALALQYLVVRLMAFFRQRKAGYDLLIVVKTMPQFSDLSIDEALMLTADRIGNKNLLQKPLIIFSHVLTTYKRQSDLDHEAKRFMAAVGTTFAVAFISDLLYAHQTGTPWHESMFALGDAMEVRLSYIMDAQKNMSEAIHTGLWGNAVSLVGVCGGLAWLLGWPIFVDLLFRTTSNMLLFFLTILSILVSTIFSLYLMKPALDYK